MKINKNTLEVRRITNKEAHILYKKYHYLSKIQTRHRHGTFVFGLFDFETLVGACTYSNFSVPQLFRSIFGVEDFRTFNQEGFLELSRFCLDPVVQDKCVSSWFLSRTIKRLKETFAKEKKRCKAIISYADSSFHKGVIYAACNFTYYGLTDPRRDIWVPCKQEEGGKYLEERFRGCRKEEYWKRCSRGWKKHLDNGGIVVPRTRKHRFLMVFDKNLKKKVLWEERKWSTHQETSIPNAQINYK